ncbi:hypothetical protein F5Y16DRAFT_403424 [Xylariaceae sp. FL0255]|nr:hypothetical protein F5Y16DRAFT_403424 [Xylariaceae sp. FL0255]
MLRMPKIISPYAPRRRRSAQLVLGWVILLVFILSLIFYFKAREGRPSKMDTHDLLSKIRGNGGGSLRQNPPPEKLQDQLRLAGCADGLYTEGPSDNTGYAAVPEFIWRQTSSSIVSGLAKAIWVPAGSDCWRLSDYSGRWAILIIPAD